MIESRVGVVAVTTEKLQGHLRAEARGTSAAEEGVFGCPLTRLLAESPRMLYTR